MSSDFNPFSLSGKTILVTGASSGIGKSIAVASAKMGATLLITGRNAEKLRGTFNDMPPGNHRFFPVDLSDSQEVDKMVVSLPPLDGVVHCAGIGHQKVCKLINEDDIDSVMGANFKMTVLLQAKLMQHRKIKKNSSIVFIASYTANSPMIGNAIYSASKGALVSYARCLMLEVAPRQIRVNSICPAMVWTELIHHDGITREELEKEELRYPLKRFGQPEDVANLTVYMLSDASMWMTGSCVDLTGGVN